MRYLDIQVSLKQRLINVTNASVFFDVKFYKTMRDPVPAFVRRFESVLKSQVSLSVFRYLLIYIISLLAQV